jgi:hypothetical protein
MKGKSMQLSDAVIAAIVGFLSAVITSIIASWVSHRRLRAELMGKYRLELIGKQTTACESLWSVLESGSRSIGENRVVVYTEGKPHVVIPVAKDLYAALTKVFNSPSGLYFSRQLRQAIFDLRDFIGDEFIPKNQDGQSELEVSNNKAKSFHGRIANLRIALRKEIGTEDLTVSREGPAKGI